MIFAKGRDPLESSYVAIGMGPHASCGRARSGEVVRELILRIVWTSAKEIGLRMLDGIEPRSICSWRNQL